MRIFACLLAWGALAFAAPALAGCSEAPASEQAAPALELTGRVVDAADIIDDATEATLASQLEALETEVGPQMVVVTTTDLGGRDIADYARDLGNAWGVGDREKNDGLLLVIAPNERKVRIQLGLGLERVLSDDLCGDIIANDIIPSLREGAFADGAVGGVARLDYELRTRLQLRRAA